MRDSTPAGGPANSEGLVRRRYMRHHRKISSRADFYICLCLCVYIRIYIYVHICIYMCMNGLINMYASVHTHMYNCLAWMNVYYLYDRSCSCPRERIVII